MQGEKPINRIRTNNPLEDGRQSEMALQIWRGVARHLRAHNFACLPELTLKSGRRADLVAVGPKQEIWIIEVKSSIADFRADHKWPDYLDYCDRFFFASHPDVPAEIFPEDAGLIMADSFGAEILRDAAEQKISAAQRKAIILRFARAAALRLHDALDPEGRQSIT